VTCIKIAHRFFRVAAKRFVVSLSENEDSFPASAQAKSAKRFFFPANGNVKPSSSLSPKKSSVVRKIYVLHLSMRGANILSVNRHQADGKAAP
jgi:hypothetical protein